MWRIDLFNSVFCFLFGKGFTFANFLILGFLRILSQTSLKGSSSKPSILAPPSVEFIILMPCFFAKIEVYSKKCLNKFQT